MSDDDELPALTGGASCLPPPVHQQAATAYPPSLSDPAVRVICDKYCQSVPSPGAVGIVRDLISCRGNSVHKSPVRVAVDDDEDANSWRGDDPLQPSGNLINASNGLPVDPDLAAAMNLAAIMLEHFAPEVVGRVHDASLNCMHRVENGATRDNTVASSPGGATYSSFGSYDRAMRRFGFSNVAGAAPSHPDPDFASDTSSLYNRAMMSFQHEMDERAASDHQGVPSVHGSVRAASFTAGSDAVLASAASPTASRAAHRSQPGSDHATDRDGYSDEREYDRVMEALRGAPPVPAEGRSATDDDRARSDASVLTRPGAPVDLEIANEALRRHPTLRPTTEALHEPVRWGIYWAETAIGHNLMPREEAELVLRRPWFDPYSDDSDDTDRSRGIGGDRLGRIGARLRR